MILTVRDEPQRLIDMARKLEQSLDIATAGIDEFPPELDKETASSVKFVVDSIIDDVDTTDFENAFDFLEPLDFVHDQLIGSISLDIVKCIIPDLSEEINAILAGKRLAGVL
jgi:hypothetical protein